MENLATSSNQTKARELSETESLLFALREITAIRELLTVDRMETKPRSRADRALLKVYRKATNASIGLASDLTGQGVDPLEINEALRQGKDRAKKMGKGKDSYERRA